MAIHYVNNKILFNELKMLHETGIISDDLHEMFWSMCKKIIETTRSGAFNFARYSYKDDMISDAYVRCLKYAKSFDIERNTSPFSYFTEVIVNQFRLYIKKEKNFQQKKWNELSNLLLEMQSLGAGMSEYTINDNIKQRVYDISKSSSFDRTYGVEDEKINHGEVFTVVMSNPEEIPET